LRAVSSNLEFRVAAIMGCKDRIIGPTYVSFTINENSPGIDKLLYFI